MRGHGCWWRSIRGGTSGAEGRGRGRGGGGTRGAGVGWNAAGDVSEDRWIVLGGIVRGDGAVIEAAGPVDGFGDGSIFFEKREIEAE